MLHPLTRLVLLATLVVACGCASEQQATVASVPATPSATSTMPCTWTGNEAVISDGRVALAFDPVTNVWRHIARNPETTKLADRPVLFATDANRIIVSYATSGDSPSICVDTLDLGLGTWRRVATLTGKQMTEAGLDIGSVSARLAVDAVATLSGDTIVLASSNYSGTPVIGIRIDVDGNPSFLPHKNAPGNGELAVAVHNGKMLCWTYARVDENQWSVFDNQANAWQKVQSFDRAYSFGQCSVGNDVYIFGGAESSAFGWLKSSFWHYSFDTNAWQTVDVPEWVLARRDFAMVWTGNEILMWGGEAGKDGEQHFGGTNTGATFNPTTGTWATMPKEGAPPPRSHPMFLWTGREMIVWGGLKEFDRDAKTWSKHQDFHAYDPARKTWRRLATPADMQLTLGDLGR